jgi:hypothetical protein
MALPSDQQLAKLRILMAQSERRLKSMEEKHRELEEPVRREATDLWLKFYERARELGYCGVCELPLTECQCVTLASSENSISAYFDRPVTITLPSR